MTRQLNWFRNTVSLVLVLVATIFSAAYASAAQAPRRQTLDFGWRFTRGDPPGAQAAGFDDAAWTPVDLPHDWSIAGPFDQHTPAAGNGAYLPTGVGWYRKTFQIPVSERRRDFQIEFDGIYENSEVWLNGHSLGKRPFGYASMVYDLTPELHYGSEPNVIAVRADNSLQPNSRWYSGSGIYRHVWLLDLDSVYVPQWGTYVTTPKVSSAAATVDARVRVINRRTDAARLNLLVSVLDPTGVIVSAPTSESLAGLAGQSEHEFSRQLEVSHPTLWSTDSPALYTLRCELREGETVVDRYDTPFGIRTAVFDVDKGFLLNGNRVKLNGVCLHGDGGGVGTAVPEGVWARRLKLLKEMGCNAIRTSHNPPAPEFLDLCDSMGFLVMDEAFDEWEAGKRQNAYHLFFKQWWERDLTDFIRRDRNHPSVVLWSAGNEIGDQVTPRGPMILRNLMNTFHREDPTRLVTAACDCVSAEPKATPPAFLQLLDVVGYNYVDRWRNHTELDYSPDRRAFPDRRFVGTESSSMAGIRGDYSWMFASPATKPVKHGAYQKLPLQSTRLDVEQLTQFIQSYDYVSGDFMWTGIDYLGEAYWPSKVATFGALDTCGFKKDAFYFYQSQWTHTPVLHLMPHWNWKGREGQIIPVTCYTNCDAVELFLNGRSLGVKGYCFPRPGMQERYGTYPPRAFLARTTNDLHLSWDVPYEPGTLKAVGWTNGVETTDTVATTGDAAAIRLSVDPLVMRANRRDVAHVTVEVVDGGGRIVPGADDEISFELTGPARLLSVDNGDPTSNESFQANHRKAFNGLCLAIVQSTADVGPIRLTARGSGLREATLELEAKATPP